MIYFPPCLSVLYLRQRADSVALYIREVTFFAMRFGHNMEAPYTKYVMYSTSPRDKWRLCSRRQLSEASPADDDSLQNVLLVLINPSTSTKNIYA